MKDALDNTIYIGKSKALRKRVSSYFSGSKKPTKVERMVRHIDHFEVCYTDTELDALILECRLIKAYRPIYNRLLKQDHKYRYLYLDPNAARPRVKLVREQSQAGEYFGPYEKGQNLFQAVQAINTYYKLPDCKRQEIKINCLTYKSGKCLGPCQQPYDEAQFKAQLDLVSAFLRGDEEEITINYESQMLAASEQLNFEEAMAYKAIWESLKSLHFKREAMQFAISPTVSLLREEKEGQWQKLWLWFGATLIWSKVIHRALTQRQQAHLIEAVSTIYKENRPENTVQLKKEAIDEAQIIYSTLKKQSSSDYQYFISEGKIEQDQVALKKALTCLLGNQRA